jgi:hypothetical protein
VLALRSLAVEFGPAEAVDSLLVRPMLMYATPLMLNNIVLGWVVGGFVADVLFYVFAICSYEQFKGMLAVRRPRVKELESEPVAAIAIA